MPPTSPESPGPGATDRHRTLLEINNALVSDLTRDALFHAIAGALRPVVPFEGPNGAAKVLALHPNTLRSRMEGSGTSGLLVRLVGASAGGPS